MGSSACHRLEDNMEAVIRAICISKERGTAKQKVCEAELVEDHGIRGDAHAGNWHRQISLLSYEKVEEFKARGASVLDGAFGENLLVEGINLRKLPVGTLLKTGTAILEVTQIGKECHSNCEIFHQVGDCIMPREGIFAKVLKGGSIRQGDGIAAYIKGEESRFAASDQEKGRTEAERMPNKRGEDHGTTAGEVKAAGFRAAVLTLSDKGNAGEREDTSGKWLCGSLKNAGFEIAEYKILPDGTGLLEQELKRLSDGNLCDLILTTGGTGLSPRDFTPEATGNVIEKEVPGIAEAIRAYSMTITKRAMLSRAVSGIRKQTLIINLPGSRKAVEESLTYLMDTLEHALSTLTGRTGDCGRS